jgi:hypothetical protein
VDVYSREYGMPQVSMKKPAHKPVSKPTEKVKAPDMYSREYGSSGAPLSRSGSGGVDVYSREYGMPQVSTKKPAQNPVSKPTEKVRAPDMYNREYMTVGAARNTGLEYREPSGGKDIYGREYGRPSVREEPIPKAVPRQKPAEPPVQSVPVEKTVEEKKVVAEAVHQPSIFDKISTFLQGILGSK